MFEQIITIVKSFHIIKVTPLQIDEAVNSKTMNLNRLEAITTAKIINELKPDETYVDCPSTNINAYKEYLESFLTHNSKIIAEHKADLIYPVVSAASILAKVTRDREIESLKRKHNVEFGSGYPSDPSTVKFLKENYKKYDFFRKSWASYKNVAGQSKQSSLSKF
jgi:ribonuclease HII